MTVTDELLVNARSYAETFDKGDLALPPARRDSDRRVHGRAPGSARPS